MWWKWRELDLKRTRNALTRAQGRGRESYQWLWKVEGKTLSFLLAPYQVQKPFCKMLAMLVQNLSND